MKQCLKRFRLLRLKSRMHSWLGLAELMKLPELQPLLWAFSILWRITLTRLQQLLEHWRQLAGLSILGGL
ncbi:hypothetical protein SB6411_00212 [Klebsiella spallanzanii]|uniref:Uncharacterized protein n=1 Tax=Klebsiella spallanzanii TaxID=2587528 RepID=A0ABY6V5C2_9ENTR|nr:hypothetical protein SB6411_00212 [Klebsiella spallanzanii]